MRNLMIVAAMVLASATAQAGQTRSLTLASSDAQHRHRPVQAG